MPTLFDRVFETLTAHAVLVVFSVAVLPRLVLALWLPDAIIWHEDGDRYVKVASNLLAGDGFGGIEDTYRAVPTLPLLIAAVFSVVGESFTALRVVFALLGAFSCVIAFVLGRRLFGARAGLLAGLLLAGYPLHIYLSALFEYPQQLFILVMGLLFVCLDRFWTSGRLLPVVGAGFCLGLAILTAPTVLPAAPLFAFWLLFVAARTFRHGFVAAAILTVATLAVVSPWTARNYALYDRVMLVNLFGGFSFWSSNNQTYLDQGKEAVVAFCRVEFDDTTFCHEYKEIEARLPVREEDPLGFRVGLEAASWEKGLAFVAEDPARFVALSMRRFVELWSPEVNAVSTGSGHFPAIRDLVSSATYLPILALGLIGLFLARDDWRRHLPLLLYVLAISAVHSVFMPTTRYRLPLDVVLILFSAHALRIMVDRFLLGTVRPADRVVASAVAQGSGPLEIR